MRGFDVLSTSDLFGPWRGGARLFLVHAMVHTLTRVCYWHYNDSTFTRMGFSVFNKLKVEKIIVQVYLS